jgi:PAS domain S-box-containing protein
LRESEARLRDIFDGTSDLIQSIAPDGCILYVNRAWRETLGYGEEEIGGLKVFDILHPDYVEQWRDIFPRLLAGEKVGSVEVAFVAKAGRAVNVEGEVNVGLENGKPQFMRGIFRDVTERKQNEARLRAFSENLEKVVAERTGELVESEERFRQLAEAIDEVFLLLDLSNHVVYVSPAYQKIWGRPIESVYRKPHDWIEAIHADDREQVRNAFGRNPGEKSSIEFRIVLPDGTIRWIHGRGYVVKKARGGSSRVVVVAADITEGKQMSERVLRAQRLESLGTLSGGVAHDLNNALAPILLGLEMLRIAVPGEAEMLRTMESSAQRGAEMLRQLLTFAKGVEGVRVALHPHQVLGEMEKIIRATFPKNIALQINRPEGMETVLGDPTQIHQVLLNLCVNARDAMPAGGILTLAMDHVLMDAEAASAIPDARPGRYVEWRVTDTGTGIPPAVLERIFEPFYTTKGPQKGTGLGLSTVLGIVKSHGGFLHVLSRLGHGAAFSVFLPMRDSDAVEPLQRTVESADGFHGNGKSVLVVDDEESVREITRAVLENLGFIVFTADDGGEAIVWLTKERAKPHLVITDLHMPNMDGLAFVRLLRRVAPNIGVIVASGRMEEEAAGDFRSMGVEVFLDKPFTQQALISALTKALA